MVSRIFKKTKTKPYNPCIKTSNKNPFNQSIRYLKQIKHEIGVALSAFHLQLKLENQPECSVEVAFQSRKVFENGGPYLDLLEQTSREAKKDPRLKNSGKLLYFQHLDRKWPLESKTLFYDWLYLHALASHKRLHQQVLKFQTFTDIEFNPNKPINCQARAAALLVSHHQLGLLDDVLTVTQNYIEVCSKPLNR